MEKDYNLQCIDYAVAMTIQRAQEDPNLQQLATNGHLTNAILEYTNLQNARGFSSKGNGRDYILQLKKDDFEEQILKHVIKSQNAKEKLGIAQPLSFNKQIDQPLSAQDTQALFYSLLGKMNMDAIRYVLNQYLNHYATLVSNFIEERYFNSKLGTDSLDIEMNNYQNQFYYDKVDQFYKELKQEKNDSMKL